MAVSQNRNVLLIPEHVLLGDTSGRNKVVDKSKLASIRNKSLKLGNFLLR